MRCKFFSLLLLKLKSCFSCTFCKFFYSTVIYISASVKNKHVLYRWPMPSVQPACLLPWQLVCFRNSPTCFLFPFQATKQKQEFYQPYHQLPEHKCLSSSCIHSKRGRSGVPKTFFLTLLCFLNLATFEVGFFIIYFTPSYFLPLPPALPSLRLITSSSYLIPLPL